MIKEIRADFGYTVNMGNYESAKPSLGLTKTVNIEFEEEAIEEGNKLLTILEKAIMTKVAEIIGEK